MSKKYNNWKSSNKHQKFWDNEPHIIGKTFKRINEDKWFEMQQDMLLWMANTDYGRDLLCLPKKFPKILEFRKNSIKGMLDVKKQSDGLYRVKYVTDIRIGAKWANVIRHRWQEFQEYAVEYYRIRALAFSSRLPVMFPVLPQFGFAYTTSTFYPDPNPETTTVDGQNSYYGNPWATIHDATDGTGGLADQANGTFINGGKVDGSNWQINRGHLLFDASAIATTDTIDSATLTLTSNGDTNNSEATYPGDLNLISMAPATNTALVHADYNKASFGTTLYADIQDLGALPSVDGNTVDITINAAGLTFITTAIDSVAGIIKFGARGTNDIAVDTGGGGSPTTFSSFGIYFADETGTTKDPKLVVVHTAVVSFVPRVMVF